MTYCQWVIQGFFFRGAPTLTTMAHTMDVQITEETARVYLDSWPEEGATTMGIMKWR